MASTRQPYAYSSNNPLDSADPSGLCDLWHLTDCGKKAANWAKAKLVEAAPVLKVIHDVSGKIAGACALATLAVVTAEITGPCAAAFGIVTAVSGAGLYVAGKESLTGVLWAAATLGGILAKGRPSKCLKGLTMFRRCSTASTSPADSCGARTQAKRVEVVK